MDEFGMNNEAFASDNRTSQAAPRQRKPGNNAAANANPGGNRQAKQGTRPRRQAPPPPRYGIVDFVTDRRTHMAVGLTLLIVAVAMLLMAISHLANGSADQSLAQSLTMTQMADAAQQPQNIGGAFGAKLSHILLTEGLGIGAFVLVYWLTRLGLALTGFVKARFWAMSFRCMLLAVGVSIIAGFIGFNTATATHWGGSHGRYINVLAYHYAGFMGALCISLIVASILIGVYLNILIRARRLMNEQMNAMREKRRDKRERDRNRRLQDLDQQPSRAADHQPIAFDDADNAGSMAAAGAMAEAGAMAAAGAIAATADNAPAHGGDNDPLSALQDIQATNPGGNGQPMPFKLSDIPAGFAIDSDDDDTVAQPAAATAAAVPATPATAAPTPVRTTPAAAATDASAAATVAAVRTTPAAAAPVAAHAGYPLVPDRASGPSAPGAGDEPDFGVTVVEEPEQADSSVAPGEHSGLGNMYDHRADLSRYRMPGIDLLDERDSGPVTNDTEQAENKDMIVNTLKSYNIPIAKIEATVGPTVTLYEIVPAEGVRIAQIKNLEDDIALSLAALGIRIIAPIPGKGTVGIEVPNRDPRTVSIRTVLGSRRFCECNMKLPMAMGTTISNQVFIRDLADMPHLLVAGGSGQGKSVGLNCIIASLLYYKHPSELKLVLIDPKMVEFSRYARLANHYLAKLPYTDDPVVTDPIEAVATLNSLCIEMDNRYRLLRDAGAVKVEEYNRKFCSRQLNPEEGHRYLPYIVIIVDEFADLIMTAGKEVSTHIARIAQKARAVGMHMIIATQRPSTDVITGMIKANFLGRIAFRVQQMVDSKTILDRPGANQLIGRGDMLFSHNGKLERVQCAFIDSDEVDRITRFVDDQVGYAEPYMLPEPPRDDAADISFDINHRDERFDECARFIVSQQTASTSSLQRRYGIGYNKAGKIMDQMEAAGIVGPAQGSKPRAVLVDSITLETILNN